MTVVAPTLAQPGMTSESGELPPLPSVEVDRSCLPAVLFLVAAGVFWLGLGALLGVISAIKAHAPGFIANLDWLTYGRVRPAAMNALVYGFALQAGLGVGLWMLARLGRALLEGVWVIIAAGVLWNLGVVIGLGQILGGASTGYEWLEIPRAASPILFVANVLIGACGLLNLHLRRQRRLYVSQWLILTALLWFPWVYSTAQLLLVFFPVRGIMQAVVNGWYRQNLFELSLAPFALATIFYLLPSISGRPLFSHGLALFGFWLLVFLGGWGGLEAAQPVPNWISSVGVVTRVLLLVGVAAFALGWYVTLNTRPANARRDPILRFVLFGAASYVLGAVLEAVGLLPRVNDITGFTLYFPGVNQLQLHGFLAMSLAAGIYFVGPRLAARPWPYPGLMSLHFWCSAFGTALTVLALVVGGVVQGNGIDNPRQDFLAVVRATVPFLGTSTLGAVLLLVGYTAFGLNVIRLSVLACPCSGWLPSFRSLLLNVPKGEAKR